MPTKLKITVTKDILNASADCGSENGQPLVTHCAIALAVRDVFPQTTVLADSICIQERDKETGFLRPIGQIQLPVKAKIFIAQFDLSTPEKRKEMSELEFEIRIPDSVIATVNIDDVKKILTHHPTMELV